MLLFAAFVPDVVTGADVFRNLYTWFYVQLRPLTIQKAVNVAAVLQILSLPAILEL